MDAVVEPADQAVAPLAVGLANIVVHVSDPDRSLRLYRDGLGFAVNFDSGWNSRPEMLALTDTPDGTSMRIISLRSRGSAGLSLVSFGQPTQTRPAFEAAGQVHIGVEVRDLDAAVARVQEYGAELFGTPAEVGPPTRRSKLAFLRDPDGVVIELVQHAEQVDA